MIASSTHSSFFGWGPVNQTDKRQSHKTKSSSLTGVSCVHVACSGMTNSKGWLEVGLVQHLNEGILPF